MSRLFTFGCSFTKYNWMTWADIVGRSFDQYHNMGITGAGNMYIFNSLVHTIVQYDINKNDTVMIMWTNVTREDRFIRGRWANIGNLATQNFYDKNFMLNYFDVRGCYERDIPTIHAARMLLDSIGCKYEIMSMVDMHNADQYKIVDKSEDVHIKRLLEKFKSTLSLFKPSVHNIIFNYDYSSRPVEPFKARPDAHPLPLEHLEYVEKVLPNYPVSESTKQDVRNNQQETIVALKKYHGVE